jgi:hypothetical protein
MQFYTKTLMIQNALRGWNETIQGTRDGRPWCTLHLLRSHASLRWCPRGQKSKSVDPPAVLKSETGKTLGVPSWAGLGPLTSILTSCSPTCQVFELGWRFWAETRQSVFSTGSAPCTRFGAPRSRTASLARRGCLTVHQRSYTATAIPPLRVPSPHGRPTSRSSV